MSTKIAPLGVVSLPPAPIRHDDPKIYQKNVEDWSRVVHATIRTYEATLRAIITKVNGP